MEVNQESRPPKTPSRHELKQIQQGIILVYRALSNFVHDFDSFPVKTKQYLPDNPIIPLKNGQDLIAVQKLRADALYTPTPKDNDPLDAISIPSHFLQKDSYAVLLVPHVRLNNAHQLYTALYDITVIKGQDDKLALKLSGIEERTRLDPLFKFPHAFVPLSIIPIDKESLTIWQGRQARNCPYDYTDKEAFYKNVVNGTICYRMVEGKAESKKSDEKAKATNRVTKLVTSPNRV